MAFSLKGLIVLRVFSDKKYNKIFTYCFAFIILTLMIVLIMFQWDSVSSLSSNLLRVFAPVIWGMVLAFVMNPISKNVERFLGRFLFRKKARPRAARAIGIVVASIFIIAVIAAIILSVIPELISNIPGIYDGLVNDVLPAAEKRVAKLLDDNPSIAEIVTKELDNISATISKIASSLVPQLTSLLTSLLDFANSVKNFIFGFILAIYFLSSKEALQAQAKKLIVALFSERTYHRIFTLTSSTNSALLSFIYGKIIDSCIIGGICAVCMLIFRMPYVMIISLIIGITNIIPVFGPFIGAIPSAVLVLIADPGKVLWFLLFIIALQQLDGNIIGPKILGNKIGLSSFWTLFSILVCGSLFGIVGMIIGVPLFAVMFDIITAIVDSRLKAKNMPTEKEYYSMPGVNIGTVTDAPPLEVIEESGIEAKTDGGKK